MEYGGFLFHIEGFPHGSFTINGVIDNRTDMGVVTTFSLTCSDGFSWEMWFLDGVLHRDDGPAIIGYRSSGTRVLEMWGQYGELRRDGVQPYRTSYSARDNKLTEIWRLYDIWNDDQPSEFSYDKHGNIQKKWWRRRASYELPLAEYFRNGECYEQIFHILGKIPVTYTKCGDDWVATTKHPGMTEWLAAKQFPHLNDWTEDHRIRFQLRWM